ncbi:ShlB/FhaC/HecB family hemolysin secretion/activation protein [Pseudomonas sp. Teo4]|uniref:ShlB/FhaC/HecB family hemolysin secretion/activation protein n=1 Tax=Pseudomonas sp. Teo4 TaxID=3064528 RepID=UPI002AB939FA|nr:ShlB/FhaC/HecB family hemolysin secretion/activation protein [Pseudomonas sp. Teo4]MDZ3996063.1 Hemolysin transporter protein ShlB [Pseudomonas sp. Teo4]
MLYPSRHFFALRYPWLIAGLLTVAQALADDPASQQLRDQQQSLRQLEQQQRLQRWQRPSIPATPKDTSPQEPIDSRCWEISGVRLAGNQLLTPQVLEATVRPLVPTCIDIASINRLLKAITQRYVEAGFPTSRPYLHQAPRDGAPLDIVIIEGFVESIEFVGAELPLSLRGAFPGMLGHPLYLPDLEQGLDQLNRLRAYAMGIDLLPGQMPGGTRVQVVPHELASRWHLDSHFDNRGSELTGRHRLTVGLGLDSPLGLNDDLRLSVVSSVFDAPGQSQGVNLHYSIPYGPWTFALNASEMRYDAPIPQSPHTTSGSSSYQGLNVERTLWRNQRGMFSVSGRLNRKQLINRSNNSVLAIQSPTLSTVEAGVNLLWLDRGLWNAYLGMTQGVDWFGADRSALRADAPSPDFRKYRAHLFHLRQGPAQWPWRWQSELALQFSDNVLPAVEQLLLNDDSAVRGFRQATFAGANAALWRNTFSQALPMDWTGPVQVRPHLGLDLGWVQLAHDAPSHRLAGAAAGLELSLPNSRLRLDYQHALYASNLPRSRMERGFWVVEWSLNI